MVKIGINRKDLAQALSEVKPIRMERVEVIAMYVGDGVQSALWAVLDFMDFNLKTVNTIKEAIHHKTGIEHKHIHVMTTHNHGGGTPLVDRLAELTADCSLEAMRSACPAHFRYAVTQLERQLSFRRRMYVPELDGCTTLFYGTSEATGYDSSPHVEHVIRAVKNGRVDYLNSEPTERGYLPFNSGDQSIFAVEFETPDHRPIGSIVRFAAHATCSNRADSYSSDYPWHIRSIMNESFGGECIFMNGPCADIACGNRDKYDGTDALIGRCVTESAIAALAEHEFEPLTEFKDEMLEISLPVRREVLDNDVPTQGEIPEALPERLRYIERERLRGTLPFLREKYSEGEKDLSDSVRVHGGFLRLNGFTIAAFPGETFSSTGQALRDAYPSEAICTVTEHERTVMYMPTAEDFTLGGYETVCMLTTPEAEKLLRDGMINRMKDIKM